MRPWEFPVALDPASGHPLFLQIARAVIADIRRGRLRPGDPLPGSRTLACSTGVHRNTVLAGYAELAAEGWVTTTVAGGTFVSAELPLSPQARLESGPSRVSTLAGFPLGPTLAWDRPPLYPPGTLVLTKGSPDVRLLPIAELARAYRRALLRNGRQLLFYGDPRGHPRLRDALRSMLAAARGVMASDDAIMVTRGSQLALDLVARALVRPGDVVAVEALGHPGAWNAFRLAGATLVPVPVDVAGLRVDALPELQARHPLRAIYLTPHHQFPTTTVMPAARRLELLEFARAHQVALVEDDYDHEFHYEGRPVLPLASADRSGVVIYVGTLSKILAPGLRIGFVVAPPPVIERLTGLRVATDLQGDQSLECAVAELFESGELGRHVRRVRRHYVNRRDALVDALRRQLGGVVEFDVPSGGMALWGKIAPDVDIDAWAADSLPHGVVFRAGHLYDFAAGRLQCARLGFTYHDERELGEAVRRMASTLGAIHRTSRPEAALAESTVLPRFEPRRLIRSGSAYSAPIVRS